MDRPSCLSGDDGSMMPRCAFAVHFQSLPNGSCPATDRDLLDLDPLIHLFVKEKILLEHSRGLMTTICQIEYKAICLSVHTSFLLKKHGEKPRKAIVPFPERYNHV